MNLLSDKMSKTLDELVTECFAINRFLDRGMSILSVKFHMKKTESILHPHIAHAFPGDLFADGISGYKDSRDCLTVYGATPMDDSDYDTPLDFINEFYGKILKLQSDVYDATEEAIEEGDHTTKVFLDGLTNNVAKFTEQAQTLVDLFEDYGSGSVNLQLLDSNIEHYITV